MYKKIGIFLMIIAIILGAFAVFNNTNSEKVATEFENQTGSCYIGQTCLHEQANVIFLALGSLSVVLFIIGGVVYYIRGKKQKPIIRTQRLQPGPRIPKQFFTEPKFAGEQKKVYDLLIGEGGSMLQGELVDKSGINKVKVSRILDKLEMQGAVERRRHGMSNIVVLKKK
ncbi:MAG: MarR family transcriptional regulator [Candidatus Aenigmarchaeota archaeon]|nr:MarR family transcriptional regulator [Candidatus Aenigmarchaeota archaeon]